MYKVTYTIDIDAPTPLEAVKKAHEIIKEQVGPSFMVEDKATGAMFTADLAYPDFMAVVKID